MKAFNMLVLKKKSQIFENQKMPPAQNVTEKDGVSLFFKRRVFRINWFAC